MKTKLWLFLLIILLLPHIRAHAQWVEQNSGVTVSLWGVCFVDSLNGWAVGANSTVIKTSTGGKDWEKFDLLNDNTVTFFKVHFISEELGFIIGSQGIIYKTSNSGTSWNKSETGIVNDLVDISFLDEERGWACGNIVDTNWSGVILYTSDGGNSWNKQMELTEDDWINFSWFDAIEAFGTGSAYTIGLGGLGDSDRPTNLFLTEDYGEHWIEQQKINFSAHKLEVISKDTLWAGGEKFGISVDGGLSWNVNGLGNSSVFDIQTRNGKSGWVVTSGGKIFFVDNLGTTWIEQVVPENSIPTRIFAYNNNLVWAVGKNGKIIHYNSKPSSVEEQLTTPKLFELKQNYPNPFNVNTKIKFNISEQIFLELDVYNILGEHVTNVVSGIFTPGNYTFDWEAKDKNNKDIPSGIYFISLRSQSFFQSRKTILLK